MEYAVLCTRVILIKSWAMCICFELLAYAPDLTWLIWFHDLLMPLSRHPAINLSLRFASYAFQAPLLVLPFVLCCRCISFTELFVPNGPTASDLHTVPAWTSILHSATNLHTGLMVSESVLFGHYWGSAIGWPLSEPEKNSRSQAQGECRQQTHGQVQRSIGHKGSGGPVVVQPQIWKHITIGLACSAK